MLEAHEQARQALLALAEEGVPGSLLLARLLHVTESRGDALELALLRVGHCLGWGSEYYALAHIGQGGGWQAHLAQAVYFIVRCDGDAAALEQALERAEEPVRAILEAYLRVSGAA